ncbi:MAG: hypothetical protein IKB58_00900, partial [Oscillospiraceae bacterium]|nr:hypothetical protein [Oscillospiraceae bacterium]
MDKKTKLFEYLTIGLFAIALLGGSVLAQIPALRPDYSEEEKRELAKFPHYSTETLADGSYFSSISLWFSDTFPFREQLVALNAAVESLHGKTSIQISGNVVEGDEIPDDAEASAPVEDEPIEEPPVEEGFHDDDGIDENYTDPEDPGAVQKFGAVLQVGDTAYEYYGFSESAAHAYASMVNDTAALLGENVQVYTMVVPNSMGVMLPDSLRGSIKTGDQEKAIDFIYAQMSEQVQTVPVYAPLRAHRSEYIYFRTDHHWTALGAYYAYTKLASVNDWDPNELSR